MTHTLTVAHKPAPILTDAQGREYILSIDPEGNEHVYFVGPDAKSDDRYDPEPSAELSFVAERNL
jgi:hypothetical protein